METQTIKETQDSATVEQMRPNRSTMVVDPAQRTQEKYPRADGKYDDPARNAISWATLTWLILLHVGALAAPFTFTWMGVLLVLGLHWLTGGVGICLGFHRYLTHSSFQTTRPVRFLLGLIGGLAGEGAAIDWVANHRKHHAHSDQEGDPHSPHDGGWWSHITWLAWQYPSEEYQRHIRRWAPDLLRDPMMVFLKKAFLPSHFALGALLYGLGYLAGGASLGLSFVVWGMFVRLCFVLHATWLVNSASHMWGYRNYTTTDDSRNNWFVALLTFGEGWHNNHHAFPRMAAHGHRWWEVDPTFGMIRLLHRLGLAWNIVDYKRGSEKLDAAKQAERADDSASESIAG
jgi:stearoyl-CoA desaturase (delta-9 desaturase)